MKSKIMVLTVLNILAALVIATAQTGSANDDNTRKVVLSETDTYLDLRTGTTFRVQWDGATNTYVRQDKQPLDLYVSTLGADTFWGPQAYPVNNMLIRDGAGYYAVDQLKLSGKFKENGEGTKWKGDDDSKIKANENELKVERGDTRLKASDDEFKLKHGDDKIKQNENEFKEKTGDGKVKKNGNEQKAKDAQGKLKDNGKEVKYKEEDGTKVKSNDKKTKVKTEDSKTIFNHQTGEVKTKPR